MNPTEALDQLKKGYKVHLEPDDQTWFQMFRDENIYWMQSATPLTTAFIAIFRQDQFVRAFTQDKRTFKLKNDSV